MISKIIFGRLRPLLNRIVDLAQVAFVPNRWINENVVLAHEIIHSFKHIGKKKNASWELSWISKKLMIEWNGGI